MGCALDLQENVGNNGVDVEQGVGGELPDQSLSSAEGTENQQRTEGESLHGKGKREKGAKAGTEQLGG